MSSRRKYSQTLCSVVPERVAKKVYVPKRAAAPYERCTDARVVEYAAEVYVSWCSRKAYRTGASERKQHARECVYVVRRTRLAAVTELLYYYSHLIECVIVYARRGYVAVARAG